MSSALSTARSPSSIESSSKSSGSGSENLENLVSSSSGYSTFVTRSTTFSEETGIASIMRGMSSASNPYSYAACCIMSRKRSFAFSVP